MCSVLTPVRYFSVNSEQKKLHHHIQRSSTPTPIQATRHGEVMTDIGDGVSSVRFDNAKNKLLVIANDCGWSARSLF